jgi:hypothetical protein
MAWERSEISRELPTTLDEFAVGVGAELRPQLGKRQLRAS